MIRCDDVRRCVKNTASHRLATAWPGTTLPWRPPKKKKKKTERKPTEKTSESSPKVDSIVFCCKELGPDDSMSQWRRFLFSTLFLSILRPTKTRWRLDGPAVRGWRLNQNPNEESHYTLVTRPFFLPAGAVLLSTDPQFHSETR